jgi:hypothetical protein
MRRSERQWTSSPAEAAHLTDKDVDALRRGSHLSHEARQLAAGASKTPAKAIAIAFIGSRFMRYVTSSRRSSASCRMVFMVRFAACTAGTLAGLVLAVFRPKGTDGHAGREMAG